MRLNHPKSRIGRRCAPVSAKALIMAATTIPAAVTIFLALSSISYVVRAEEQKLSLFHAFSSAGAVTELRNYLVKIKHEKPADLAGAKSANDALVGLKEYASQVGLEVGVPVRTASPTSASVKLAAATMAKDEATYVGTKVCLGCHQAEAAVFSKTLMGRIGKVQPGTMECENCHGPGSAHAKAGGGRGVGGIISFRPNDVSHTADQDNAICLGCHDKGAHILWRGSTHQTRQLRCTNCHTVMKNVSRKHQLKKPTVTGTCVQCHKNKLAQIWRTSHMPVGVFGKNKMSCSDCHSPHGSINQSLLKKATVNEVCYECHAEKRGPFLFEHVPVRENCLNCHNPHGSNNDFLLKISRPRLCNTCHEVAHFATSAAKVSHSCQNCHSQHHGSNSPSGVRFQR